MFHEITTVKSTKKCRINLTGFFSRINYRGCNKPVRFVVGDSLADSSSFKKCQNMPNDAFLCPNVPKCAQTGNRFFNLL